MILSGIGKRYALALFNAASNQDIAEQVYGDITSFDRLYAGEPRFRNYLGSPQVTTADKKTLITSVIGDRASGLFVKFVLLLIDKKRLDHIAAIAVAYTFMFEEENGIVEVKAVTAVPLDHDMELKTRQTIEAKMGKKVRIVRQTDPSIIGGMILLMKDRIIDGSIRHQLATMRKTLGGLKVH